MPNKRGRQLKRFAPAESVEERMEKLAAALFKRLTEEDRPIPSSAERLVMDMVKTGELPNHMSHDEKEFLWVCFRAVNAGAELDEDEFFAKCYAAYVEGRLLL